MDLKSILPLLLPKAIEWAENQQRDILASVRILSADEVEAARGVGVSHPEKIRIKAVETIPMPKDSILSQAAIQVGFVGSSMAGLTLFYGIFIREGAYSGALIAHECRHVYQYEQRRSISAFLQDYLPQLLISGYFDSPLETDARDAATKYEQTLAVGKTNH